MIEGIEPFYQRIAEAIQEAIPEEWATAKMDVIFYPGSSIYEGEFIRKSDGMLLSFETPDDAGRAFRELRKLFKASGKPLWGQACFELDADGKFNMKWGYENCDADGNTRFVEGAELKRHEERCKRLFSAKPTKSQIGFWNTIIGRLMGRRKKQLVRKVKR